MSRRSSFAGFHPAVLFIYYIFVIVFAVFTTHPVTLLCVLAGGIGLFGLLHPVRVLAGNLVYYFFMFLLIALCNPLFVHNGETILFFLNDNPVTLESICYGAAVAAMIVSVIFWCKNYTVILTSDKFLYLFGRLIPTLSLVLSMAIRFIPLFKRHAEKIGKTQKTLGLYASDSRIDRLMGGMRMFDSLLSWALENSIDTADAMRARGYGLPGRTNYSLFRFHKRDGILLGVILLLAAMIATFAFGGGFYYAYYPSMQSVGSTLRDILRYGVVLLFMLLPSFVEIKENIQWNCLKSKI